MGQAALGRAVRVSVGAQTENGFPAKVVDFRSIVMNLPFDVAMVRTEAPDGSVNPSGFATPMVPSVVNGAVTMTVRFLTGDMLEFAYNLFKSVTKTPLQGGVAFLYEFIPSLAGPDWAMTLYSELPPVEVKYTHGVKFGVITVPLGTGDSTTLVATMTGFASQEQRFGVREPDVGNSGSLDDIFVRGPIRYPGLGDLYIQVVDASVAPVTFTAEITDGVPTFPNIAAPSFIGPGTGRGAFQSLQGAVKFEGTVTVAAGEGALAGEFVGVGTRFLKRFKPGNTMFVGAEIVTVLSVEDDLNLTLTANHVAGVAGVIYHGLNRDLGFQTKNKDPVEWAIQGTGVEHVSGITDLDFWRFPESPVSFEAPFAPEGNGGPLTGAHTLVEWRRVGETVYQEAVGTDVELVLSWPLEEERGTGSRYATAIDRIGEMTAVLNFSAIFRDENKVFIQAATAHEKFQIRITIASDQLGDGLIRNSHVFRLNHVGIAETHPASDVGRITIATIQSGTTDDTGIVSPVEWDILCERDWDPLPV